MPHTLLPEDTPSCHPPIYAWVFQVVSIPQVSKPKLCYTFPLPIRATCPAHLIPFDMITQKSLVIIFPIPLLPRPSKAQIFF